MEPEPNRTVERPTDRAILTEFYAGFNRLVTDRGGRDELAATLADDVRWTIVADADGERSARSYTGIDAVVEHVAARLRESATHLQALPERFAEADDGTVVEGTYVGTTDETTFDVPFVHAHELEDGLVRRCRAEIDTPDDRRISDP